MFDWKKFLSGFNLFNGEKLGKILFFGILIVIALALYRQFTRPTTTIIAKPGSNVQIEQKMNGKQKNFFIGGGASQNTVGIFGGFLF